MNNAAEYVIQSTNAPVVEIDTEAQAAYVRFLTASVHRTVPLESNVEGLMVLMDLDEGGSVVGIEIVGACEFSIQKLLEQAHVEVPVEMPLAETRYVAAQHG